MKYVIDINENGSPEAVRYWATVQGLGGCFLAEETIEELFRTAPGVIRDFIEVSNQGGANILMPTEFEFRRLVHA